MENQKNRIIKEVLNDRIVSEMQDTYCQAREHGNFNTLIHLRNCILESYAKAKGCRAEDGNIIGDGTYSGLKSEVFYNVVLEENYIILHDYKNKIKVVCEILKKGL